MCVVPMRGIFFLARQKSNIAKRCGIMRPVAVLICSSATWPITAILHMHSHVLGDTWLTLRLSALLLLLLGVLSMVCLHWTLIVPLVQQ